MAAQQFVLSLEEYEALIALSRKGADTSDDLRRIDIFLKNIEKENGITRYALWIQWQELDQPLPPGTNFPTSWPPTMRFFLENLTRPIAKADVTQVVASKAKKPTSVLVTPDPAGLVGWTEVDSFFVT